ncbi:MAG: ribosome-associated protein [Saprospiraceae bacterium]|jgi:ribosome-associated protein
MQNPDLSNLIISALENSKAKNIETLDVTQLTDTTDKMIICSGTSGRHVASIAKGVQDELSEQGIHPLSSEGESTKEWILIDYVHVVVHLMKSETRSYYDLESLWDTRLAKARPKADEYTNDEEKLPQLNV